MKKNLKLLSAILALSLVFSLISGCSDTDTPTDEDANETSPATESAAPTQQQEEDTPEPESMYPLADEMITMTAWIGAVNDAVALADNDLNNCANVAAAEDATNIHLDWFTVAINASAEQLGILVASNEFPDLFTSAVRWYSTGASGLLEDEVCIDLMPYLKEYAPDYYEIYLSDDEYAKLNTTDGGELVQMSTRHGYTATQGTMIRKDWLDSLDLDIPETYDELTDVLKAFSTEIETTTNTLALTYIGVFGTNPAAGWLTGGYGVPQPTSLNDLPWHVDEDGNVVMSYDDEGYFEYFSMLAQWHADGIFTDDILNHESHGDYESALLNGEIGYGLFDATFLSEAYAALSSDPDNFVLYPMADVTKTGTETIRMGGIRSLSVYFGFSVSSQCSDPETAIKYINWYWTPEGESVSNFGVENVAWEYDENGDMQYTDLVMNSEGVSIAVAKQVYCGLLQTGFNTLVEATYLTYDNEIQVESSDIWSSNRTAEGIYRGTLTVDEQAVYFEKLSDMVTFMQECVSGYIVGQRSLDQYWDDIDQLYGMGLQSMVEVKQAAYDRYQAR